MIQKRLILLFAASVLLSGHSFAQRRNMTMPQPTVEQKAMYATSTADLKSWMTFLTSPECRGRLTGDIGFAKATRYAADLFKACHLAF